MCRANHPELLTFVAVCATKVLCRTGWPTSIGWVTRCPSGSGTSTTRPLGRTPVCRSFTSCMLTQEPRSRGTPISTVGCGHQSGRIAEHTLPRPDIAVVELGLVRSRPPCLHECSFCPSGNSVAPLAYGWWCSCSSPGIDSNLRVPACVRIAVDMAGGWWMWM